MGLFSPPMTKDDRGREVPLWAGAWGHSGSDVRRDLPPDVLAKLMSGWSDPAIRGPGVFSLRLKLRRTHVMAILLWILVVVLAGFLTAILRLPGFTVPVVSGLAGVAFAIRQQQATRGKIAEMTRHTLLDEGYCPCCAYALADLPSEADGCVVCPECDSAWKRRAGVRFSGQQGQSDPPLWKPELRRGWVHENRLLAAITVGAFGHARLVMIQDDSGKLVEVIRDPHELRATPGWKDLSHDQRLAMVRVLRRRQWLGRVGVLMCLFLVGVLFSVTLARSVSLPPQASVEYVFTIVRLVLFGLGLLAVPLWMWRPPGWDRSEHAQLFKRGGLCPRCATRLGEDGSGCGVCGAVWKSTAGPGGSRPGHAGTAPDPKRT